MEHWSGVDRTSGAGTRSAMTEDVAPRPVPSNGTPLPGAVAEPVCDLVTGPLRPATVVAVHHAAVALCCDAVGDAAGDSNRDAPRNAPGNAPVARIVTVLTSEASGVPNGVRTLLRAADDPFRHLTLSSAAMLGAGTVQLPGLTIRGVRRVRHAVPLIRLRGSLVAALVAAVPSLTRGVPDAPVARLNEALAGGDAAELRAAVTGLVGLGDGSTPGGDDVLCGALTGLHATGRTVLAHQVAVAALQDLAGRTTLISANLLRLAAQGYACSEANAVLRASHVGSLRQALDRLVALGHTSGADLATGLAIGLTVPTQPQPRAPRRRAPARA